MGEGDQERKREEEKESKDESEEGRHEEGARQEMERKERVTTQSEARRVTEKQQRRNEKTRHIFFTTVKRLCQMLRFVRRERKSIEGSMGRWNAARATGT